jgi:hypothetical protein
VKTFSWNTLFHQYLLLGPRFVQRHKNDWLVWEPGAWSVPKGNISVVDTAPPLAPASPRAPAAGDPLCFALEGSCTIGRAEGNEVVLSDATISRHHCLVEPRDGGWWVTRHREGGLSKIDGIALQPGGFLRLVSGARIELGQIVLTFLGVGGLLERFGRTR